MVDIRPYRPSDLDKLYDICLATGDAGGDAAHLFSDPRLLGHVYAGPYGVLAPEAAFVAEDEEGVGGYILGTRDTAAFDEMLETRWWPALRMRYPEPLAIQTPDARMQWLIHRPQRMTRRIVEAYPAHLHIDLLPRLQGGGLGKRMIDIWRATVGAPTHLAVGGRNTRAVRFYRAYGFHEIERFDALDVIVFGIE
jgi:ribosomal protein S18 acetylase RimI-like enzyme